MRTVLAVRRTAVVALAACGGLGLAACGGATKTVTVPAPAAPPPAASTPTPRPTPPVAASHAPKRRPSARLVHVANFRSPTGNIGCAIAGGAARCDISQRSWTPPPRPSSCSPQVDFGQGLEIGKAGAARFVCAGDTARDPSSPKLAYDTGTQVDGFICMSRFSGMRCTNSAIGHGFTISAQGYKLF